MEIYCWCRNVCVCISEKEKAGAALWGYWCYSVENRERKHTYFRHFVFFPWRYNKIKHFPLHTHFLFVWKRKREKKASGSEWGVWHLSLLKKAGAPQSSERFSCLAAVGEQNASLVSDIKLLCWKPSWSWCDKWILPAAEKYSPHLAPPPRLPNLPPGALEQKAALRHHLLLPASTLGPAFTSVKQRQLTWWVVLKKYLLSPPCSLTIAELVQRGSVMQFSCS